MSLSPRLNTAVAAYFCDKDTIMRKLKFQMQTTLDGFVSGPNGEMDWVTWNWGQDIKDYVTAITEPVDTMLLGRVLAEGFIPHWTAGLKDNMEGAQKIVETPKVVFTKTMQDNPWENTVLANGDLADEVNRLKRQEGGDIIAYGGVSFAASLITNNLIDEYHLFVNPVAIGKGRSIYDTLGKNFPLKLIDSKAFECGITLLCFQPAQK